MRATANSRPGRFLLRVDHQLNEGHHPWAGQLAYRRVSFSFGDVVGPHAAWAAFNERRYAEPWWFVSGVRAWHAIALVESPLAFRKRGVFLTASALERV